MASIKFENTELVNSTYIPRYARHESAPVRDVAVLELAREDGAVFVSERYGTKRITIVGRLTANSRSNLDSAIDDFKELFQTAEGDLEIGFAGGTRTYMATCVRHNFNRDHFHNLFVPWTAEFLVAEGIGRGATQEAVNGSFTSDADTLTMDMSKGSIVSKPYSIELTFNTVSGSGRKGVAIAGEDFTEKMYYTQSSDISAGDKLRINCEDKKVELDTGGGYAEVGFHGLFPEFLLSNSATIRFWSGLLDIGEGDETPDSDSAFTIGLYGTRYMAQSFMIPWKDNSVQCVRLAQIMKAATPDPLVIRIETDSGGEPSGDLVDANATAGVGGASGTVDFEFPDSVTLEANTKYWLVAKQSVDGGDASNYYQWERLEPSWYGKGMAAYSDDSGGTWIKYPTYDRRFLIYIGGIRTGSASSVGCVVDYYPYYL